MNSHSRVPYRKIGLVMLAEAMNVTTASIWATSGFSNAPLYPKIITGSAPVNDFGVKTSCSLIGRVAGAGIEEEGE